MNKFLLTNLKLAVFVILLTSLTFASGFTSTKSLLLARVSSQSGNPNVRVWVNTNSGVYHCPNTRWYGNTKSGKFMTQKEAQAKGYRPAYGAVCG